MLDTIDKTYTNKYKEAIANSAWEEVKKSMQKMRFVQNRPFLLIISTCKARFNI